MPTELQSGESLTSFAQRIKQKYPVYAGVEDAELVERILEKYPMYRDRISLPAPTGIQEEARGGLPPLRPGEATIRPRKMGLGERVKRVFTEGIPRLSSRTVYNPKYTPIGSLPQTTLAFEVLAGKLLNQYVKALANDPFFQRADFDRRRSALMKAVSRARQFAKFQVMQERGLQGRTPRIPTGRERRLPNTLLEEVRRSQQQR